jgi:hypothetical protein
MGGGRDGHRTSCSSGWPYCAELGRFRYRISDQIQTILRLFRGKSFLTQSEYFFLSLLTKNILSTGVSFVDSDSNPLALRQVFLVIFSLFKGKKFRDEASIRSRASQLVVICFEKRLKGTAINFWAKKSDSNSY